MSGGELLPQHLEYLNARAVSPEAVRARGYWSATESKQLERLFANREQRRLVPAMVIPVHDVWGNNGVAQIRPDEPRVIDGRSRKFEWPSKVSMAVDVPPIVQPILGDPSVPLVITEGSIKADAAVSAGLNAISLQGVWAWRGTNDKGGKTALPDLEAIAFNNRVVYMAFDSDAMVKMDVYRALRRFAELLAGRGAEIRIVYLPHGDGGCKTGLDDFLAGGRTAADLLALASDELREPGGAASNGKAEAPPEVDGELLLADLRGFIGRYMVLPSDEVADLLVLWTLHTHAIESAFATPYLRIVSAAPNSGKTLLLEILAKLTCRGWHAIMPSLAVMYRKVDAHSPTLLLDEMDGYNLDERTDALGVLNSGYKRGATVDRCKESGELEEFKTFCAKAFAGLDTKAMAPSLLSRTITIRLERKLPGEGTEMWIEQLTAPAAQELRERCAAWAFHNVGALNDARPELPRWLHNRAAEVWWALLAVADRIGGEWPARAREVSRVLGTGGDSTDEKPEIVMLLEDINAAFGASTTIFTEELLPKLNAIEERPWGALRRGEGLDARGWRGSCGR